MLRRKFRSLLVELALSEGSQANGQRAAKAELIEIQLESHYQQPAVDCQEAKGDEDLE